MESLHTYVLVALHIDITARWQELLKVTSSLPVAQCLGIPTGRATAGPLALMFSGQRHTNGRSDHELSSGRWIGRTARVKDAFGHRKYFLKCGQKHEYYASHFR